MARSRQKPLSPANEVASRQLCFCLPKFHFPSLKIDSNRVALMGIAIALSTWGVDKTGICSGFQLCIYMGWIWIVVGFIYFLAAMFYPSPATK